MTCLAAAGCEPVPDGAGPTPVAGHGLALRPVAYGDLPGWDDDRISGMLPALLAQCERLAALPPDASLGGAAGIVTQGSRPADWRPFCGALQWVRPGGEALLRHTLEVWLQPYEVSDRGDPAARFGGYFDPEFPGSLAHDAAHPVAVYRRPPDLVSERVAGSNGSTAETVTGRMQAGRLVPYWTRAQIDQGAIAGQGLALVWLDNPVDLFSLQLQGSGRVRLSSGQIVRLGFDGTNGAPYVPLGRMLVRDGQMTQSEVSLPSIRAWLAAHPAEAQSLIEQNPNYVFFRVLDNLRPDEGPLGALQLDLRPLRSVAIDRLWLPLAAPIWIDTTRPSGEPLRQLMLAQDLGTDIDRPTGADIFFGWGEEAAREAGAMRTAGRMTVLLPRPPR